MLFQEYINSNASFKNIWPYCVTTRAFVFIDRIMQTMLSRVAYELRYFSAIRINVKVAATLLLFFRFRGHGLKTFKDFPVSKGRLLHPLKLSGVSWPPQDIESETTSEIVLRLRYNSQERRKESSCFCTKIWSVIQELIYSEKATKI